jgi:hypothetical protein
MCKCGSVVSQTRIMAHLKILGLKTKTCVGIYGSIPVIGQLVCSSFCADEKNAVSLALLLLTADVQRHLILPTSDM